MILKKAHRCTECGKIIAVGSKAVCRAHVKEKFYPVKGIMRFTCYNWYHENCCPKR